MAARNDCHGNDLRAHVAALKIELAVLKSEAASKDKALEKQAHEYERRLHDLNDAHAEAREVLATYVTREVYDKMHDGITRRVADLEVFKERVGATGAAADYIGRALWALGGGAIVAFLMFLMGPKP